MISKRYITAVTFLAAVAMTGGSKAATDLKNTVWIATDLSGCTIQEIHFGGDGEATLEEAWDKLYADWSLKGGRLVFGPIHALLNLQGLDAKLTGGFKGEGKLDLTFKWTARSYMPHLEDCVYKPMR
jgi:hypothetical protein